MFTSIKFVKFKGVIDRPYSRIEKDRGRAWIVTPISEDEPEQLPGPDKSPYLAR
jgi:hypothetical protein